MLDAIHALRSGTETPPPGGAEIVAAAPNPAAAGFNAQAERRQLTVMFVDLVGSTALSARFDPEEMGEAIRAYQDACAGSIARFEGVVSKFMGDGVMAYFGFPRAHENDAERAVCAGLDLVKAIGRLRAPDGTPLGVRVGIATGMIVVGDLIGSGPVRERSAVGETPNLAARLQALAEPDTVVIAHSTRELVGGLFEYADAGSHSVKGSAEPVQVWRVLGQGSAQGRFEALHGAALTPLVGRKGLSSDCSTVGVRRAAGRDRWCCWAASLASASRASCGRCRIVCETIRTGASATNAPRSTPAAPSTP